MYRRLILLLAIAAVGFLPGALRAAERIDLALVLAVDSSGSVNQQRFEQQRNGYADALVSKQVLQAILGGENKRIAVTYFEWSDGRRMARLVPWTLIDSEASARAVSKIIREHRRQLVGDTCIPCAIDEAMTYFRDLPYETDRRVLDISGDGESNVGGSVDEARDRALIADITINGLPILNEEPDLEAHYRARVIGGPGAFCVPARDYRDFREAIRDKLVREIRFVA